MKDHLIDSILKKAEVSHVLREEEIVYLLKTDGLQKEKLFKSADRIRAKYVGNAVYLRGIIEFSNYCRCNCFYCGLRKDNQRIKRYRLTADQILNMAENAGRLGYKTVVLQSGEDQLFDGEKLAWIIEKIKARVDTAVTLSVGERTYDEYKMWKKAGADRYLIRHETIDKDIYQKFHPGMKLEERIERLYWLKELGYQVGSGNLIGLPGQNEEVIAADILFFKMLDLEMVGLGPLVTNPHTPLKDIANGSIEMTLKTIAITRLLLPQAHIPGTTALGTIDPRGRQKALKAGANVIMPNVTQGEFRPLYALYPDKICVDEQADNCRECIGGIINSLGRYIGSGYGHSPKSQFQCGSHKPLP